MQTEIAQVVYFLYTLASLSKALYTSAPTAATTCLGLPRPVAEPFRKRPCLLLASARDIDCSTCFTYRYIQLGRQHFWGRLLYCYTDSIFGT